MRFKSTLLLCTISLLSLAACGQPQASTSTTEPSPVTNSSATNSPATNSPVTESATASQTAYPELLTVVTNTQTAVKANDFAKAQQEFDQFESVWSPVEDGIKAKSSASYDAIENDMDQVNAALKAANAEQANTALQNMAKNIQGIPNS